MDYCDNDCCSNIAPCPNHQAEGKQVKPQSTPLVLIDVHIHLLDSTFDEDREKLLVKAQESGIATIVVVSETFLQANAILQFAPQWNKIIPTVVCCGIHPCHAHTELLSPMLEFISTHRSKISGVGEIGLDFSPHILRKQLEALQLDDPSANEETVKRRQREVYGAHLELAKRLNLPVNVHSRNAGHYAIQMCVDLEIRLAVFHAFDGKPVCAEKAAREQGYYFSIPPSVIREAQFQKLVKNVPLSHLLLETDAPALPPIHKERNVPVNLTISCLEIARIKQTTPESVASGTSKNARCLFGLS